MFSHWLQQVFSHPTPQGAMIIAGKTAVVYVFLVLGLRLMGKRELGQMNIYDLVLVIVLANAVQNSMVGDDTTLFGGIVAAITLLVINKLLTLAMTHSDKLENMMAGQPTLILNDGQLIADHMRREGVTREQVLAALREHGIDKMEDAHMCVLEVDGSISVVPNQSAVLKTRHHFKALRLS